MSKREFIKYVKKVHGDTIVHFDITSKVTQHSKSHVGLIIIAGFIIGAVIANKVTDHVRVEFTKVKSKDEQTAK